MTTREATTSFRSWMSENAQKIVTALILALLMWVGTTLQQVQLRVEVQSVRIEELTNRVERGTVNRYTSADAARDQARIETQIIDMRRRLERLENQTQR